MGQRALLAAVAAGFVLWSAQGCVEDGADGGPDSPPTGAPTSGTTPKQQDDGKQGEPAPSSPGGGNGGDGGGKGGGDGSGAGSGSGKGQEADKGGGSGSGGNDAGDDGKSGSGAVKGDPDAKIPTPKGTPEDPTDLVAAIEKAVLTRETAQYTATASLSGLRRAEADGGYVFRSEERVDFSVDLDMRSRSGDDYSARAVAEDEDFYLKPPSAEGMPDGKSWVGRSREDFEDPPEPRALYSEAIRSVSGIRDWSMIAAATDLVPAGPRTVDGVRGSGYRATFSVVDGMGEVSGKGGAWRVLQDLSAQGVREIAFTVWVTDEYLPVAVIVQMDTDDGPGHVDLQFSDWGSTVTLPVPKPGSVWKRS